MLTTPAWLLYVGLFFGVYVVSAQLASRRGRDANSTRNFVVAVGSIWLYSLWHQPAAAILVGFCVVLYFYSQQSPLVRAVSAPLLITVGLAYLAFVKYWNFTARMLDIPWKHNFYIIGISFYVFTLVGYVVDTAYRRHRPLTRFSHVVILLSFWPHLAAGPILRLENIRKHIERKLPLTSEHLLLAATLIVVGLSKKFFVADSLGTYVNKNLENIEHMNGLEALVSLLGFTAQIYFDFSGYSDIAIGAATLMGFRLPANFNHPYRAASLEAFWSRWHISLSTWLRDYLYIPLGGSRRGNLYLNLLTVFAVSGLWHGAATNFIVWGLIHGGALCLEKLLGQRWQQAPRGARHLATLTIVICAWAFFRLDIDHAQLLLSKVFTLKSYATYTRASSYYVLPVVGLLPFLVIDQVWPYYRVEADGFIAADMRTPHLVYATLMLVLFLYLGSGGLPFIYFQF
jgi:D-alanyl-lipoteichoic acid acyltransferase DltB (MBOAT superfamily)